MQPALRAGSVREQRVFGGIIRQELQRDRAVQTRVLGLVHDAHATAPELARDLVVGNCLADHWNAILGGVTRAVNRQSGFRRSSGCSGRDNSGRVVANVEVEISWYGATADCTSDGYNLHHGRVRLASLDEISKYGEPPKCGSKALRQ